MHTTTLRRFIGLAVLLVALIGGLNACTVTTTTTASQTEAITRANGWKFDKFSTGTPPANAVTAYTGATLKFASNGTSTLTVSTGQVISGTWSWTSLKVLSLTQQGVNDTWEVVELSSTTMRWSAQLNGSTLEMQWTAQ